MINFNVTLLMRHTAEWLLINGFMLLSKNMIILVLLLIITTSFVHSLKDPTTLAGLFEGDIAKISSSLKRTRQFFRNVINGENFLWPNATIPYQVSKKYKKKFIKNIYAAMQEIQSKSCIRFVQHASERDYIKIKPNARNVCFSNVGRTYGMQVVSLGRSCNHVGTIVHELMHTIGFQHEQTRFDRDEYVDIIWKNVQPKMTHQFSKSHGESFGAPYDPCSVMHYYDTAFSIKPRKLPTIVLKSNASVPCDITNSRQQLSELDVRKLNEHYNCPADRYHRMKSTKEEKLALEKVNKSKGCFDKDEAHCKQWKKSQFCQHQTYKSYMEMHCRASCNLC